MANQETQGTTNQVDPASVDRVVLPLHGMVKVRRTSLYSDENPPCDGAIRYEIKTVDRRSVDDPKKIPANGGTDGDWYKRGENHRIENGQICRDVGWHQEWFVEIKDVFEFVKKHGDCVVSVGEYGQPSIEIYDDYRE